MGALHVNEQNFNTEVIQSSLPVLIDFWAEWCGPCRMMGPIVDQLSDELQGKIKVVKVNIDEAQDLALQYDVMSIPTLIVVKGGEVVEQLVGAMPKENLMVKLQRYV